ncbi:MAG: hypothetical protein J7L96_08740 [Bacteroidales bacterium]|nr:hypothetical protein [Bacteroidales bacterium]
MKVWLWAFTLLLLASIQANMILANSQFKIDRSICDNPQDRQEYEACIIHYKPIQDEANKIRDEKDILFGNFNTKSSDYSVCWNQVCALGSSDPQNSGKLLKSRADVDRCQKAMCRPISDAFNAKMAKMEEQYKAKKAEYEKAICQNCISGYCTYKLDGDCNALSDLCKKYGGFKYVGCGDKDPLNKPLIDPKDVVTGDKPFGELYNKSSNKAPANPGRFKQKDKILTNPGLTKLTKKPDVTVVNVQTKNGIIKKILNKVDNSKATFKDKSDYYATNNIKT